MSEVQMSDRTDPVRSGGGRHPVNVGHLVMGLAFAGIVAVWGLVQSDLVGDDDVRWLLPLPWVLAGAVGLLVAALGGRRHLDRPAHDAGWVGGPTTATAEPPPGDDTTDDNPAGDDTTDDITGATTDETETDPTEENR